MNFQSRVSTNTVHDLFFAAAFNNFNFIVNTEKTVVMHQPPANVTDYAPHISVSGAQLKAPENVTYLVSTLSRNTEINDKKFGCPERFTQMVRQPRDGMMVRVAYNKVVPEASGVTDGVSHGCVFTPTHFTLICPVMLMEAYHHERPGIRVAGRADGQLPTQRLMNFQIAHELLFAAAYDNLGILINMEMTVVMQ
nr:unnamed protein product [Spirometra erinaceieuropaei]